MTREKLKLWLAAMRVAWINADIASVKKLFGKTQSYYETPFAPPVSGEGIWALWREVRRGDLDYLDYEILALDGDTAIINEKFSWRGMKRDGIYQLEFDAADACVFFKRWKIVEPEQFIGIVIAESLSDKSVITKFEVIKTLATTTPWHMYWLKLDEAGIREIQKNLVNENQWYADFASTSTDRAMVVFKNKIFDIKKSDKSTWQAAIDYGISAGIPASQMGFDPARYAQFIKGNAS
ncbi:MAG: hypothetical protein FWD15_05430 [Alphaproteobacteria bacterium]|nr:hypothetical protein [Alphaproteobacteria bacterium]